MSRPLQLSCSGRRLALGRAHPSSQTHVAAVFRRHAFGIGFDTSTELLGLLTRSCTCMAHSVSLCRTSTSTWSAFDRRFFVVVWAVAFSHWHAGEAEARWVGERAAASQPILGIRGRVPDVWYGATGRHGDCDGRSTG